MLIDVPIFALVPCFLIEGACFFLLCACSIFLSLRLHYALNGSMFLFLYCYSEFSAIIFGVVFHLCKRHLGGQGLLNTLTKGLFTWN